MIQCSTDNFNPKLLIPIKRYLFKVEKYNSAKSELLITNAIIAENNKQLLDRWGDLPVLGSVLNYMEVQITILKNIKYTHLSHQNKFKISKKIRS